MPANAATERSAPAMTFSAEFDTVKWWDGSSGFDTRPAFAMASWADSGFGWSADSDTWYLPADPVGAQSPFSIQDGILTITARTAETAYQDPKASYDYTSGAITTFHDFSQLYGYFEIRAKISDVGGTLPAFWMLPVDQGWPPELDIMEVLGSDPSLLHATVHSQKGGAIQVGATHYQTGHSTRVVDLSEDFHTYAVDWQADHVTWYLDGAPVHQIATPEDMHRPMYLLANLNVGGTWEGRADPAKPFEATYQIDYIRAYDARPLPPKPVIHSDGGDAVATVTLAENTPLVTTVVATSADGSRPALSIAGGADAALFGINPESGALVFLAAPDYEAPRDAGGDNVYEVTVQAGSGASATQQAITVSVSDVNDPGILAGLAAHLQALSDGGAATSVFTSKHYDAGWRLQGEQAERSQLHLEDGRLFEERFTTDWKLQRASITSETEARRTVSHYDGQWRFTGAEIVDFGLQTRTAHFDTNWKQVGTDIFRMDNGKAIEEHYDAAGRIEGIDVGTRQPGRMILEHFDAAWKPLGAEILTEEGGSVITQHFDRNWVFTAADVTSAESFARSSHGVMTEWLLG
ncbi:family 16 glycosylhydrolase [Roseomonas sp. E05]|uniref:family 16 glycosylhydrolase n=1 Tax=Roseomonas sp. E05 TaxID=3046310 RepID=UPI0024BA8838|nr:family 16 glycosylhydrolase [Roseomonas sp. E05]MDJ0391616.1 family 16 glycosylhydrolase [Roseomonas sp. E05]